MNAAECKNVLKLSGTKRRGTCPTVVTLIALLTLGLGACTEGDEPPANVSGAANTAAGSANAAQGPQALGKNALYSIDIINGQPIPKGTVVVVTGPELTMGGWAVDQQSQGPAGAVYVTVDGKKDVPTQYGAERKDVAAVQKNPRYQNSGFAASIMTSALEKGRHTLGLKILTADRKGYYEPDQKIEIDVR